MAETKIKTAKLSILLNEVTIVNNDVESNSLDNKRNIHFL